MSGHRKKAGTRNIGAEWEEKPLCEAGVVAKARRDITSSSSFDCRITGANRPVMFVSARSCIEEHHVGRPNIPTPSMLALCFICYRWQAPSSVLVWSVEGDKKLEREPGREGGVGYRHRKVTNGAKDAYLIHHRTMKIDLDLLAVTLKRLLGLGLKNKPSSSKPLLFPSVHSKGWFSSVAEEDRSSSRTDQVSGAGESR
ncbi:hypothetical protein ARMGADRAFT_1089760 [Armillaria gallica]|uniref:Uncharacterized protein n=1 Tax=Armillaria gallica TaxID=47427 RepID=A0A2H3D3W7_ARMGA|nr:hypothetical protein ARMGADRAFT_1089760 [Armillaria gallica]